MNDFSGTFLNGTITSFWLSTAWIFHVIIILSILAMATYLLLRNNIECGPYSLLQMQEIGLKPYDLVWVEGRSAAWRYPGEVDELKEFAPPVKEQPYDRFYKKPGEKKEKHFYELIAEAGKKEEAVPVKKIQTRKKKNTSKIYVSMPVKSSVPVVVIPENRIPDEKEYVNKENAEQKGTSNRLTEKYSQPLDDIKKIYLETYLNRKQKNIQKENLKKIAQLSAAVVFVLAIGSLVYMNFKSNEMETIKPVAEQTGITETKRTDLPPVDSLSTTLQVNESSTIKPKPVTEENLASIVRKNKKNEDKKNIVENNEPAEKKIKITAQQNTGEGQRNKSVRDNKAVLIEKPVNIFSLVSVKANEYKRRAFGGIENLQLTVVNSSNYILDKVVVELQYLKPSELPLKTESIQFAAIAPNGSMTIRIPDSPRGIKVVYKIIQVESGQFDKTTAGL